jgi:hypothetical protein
MLGQDFVGPEPAVVRQRPVRDDPLPLPEQVGQDAGVDNRDDLGVVGQRELDFERAGRAFDAAVNDQTADAETAPLGGLAGRHLRRAVIKQDVLVHRAEQERSPEPDHEENETDTDEALVSGFH